MGGNSLRYAAGAGGTHYILGPFGEDSDLRPAVRQNNFLTTKPSSQEGAAVWPLLLFAAIDSAPAR